MRIEFLDKGFIELIDSMGNDYRVLQAARVSTGSDIVKGEKKDRGLIRYLYKQNHSSPFEMVQFTFHAKLPIAMAVHLIRHRTFSFNFESSRYKEMDTEFYKPENWRIQNNKNKQGSNGIVEKSINIISTSNYSKELEKISELYHNMLSNGISKEMARFVLPESLYTELYFTVDLKNLLHFLTLRLHNHTQYETREFANAVFEILKNKDDIKWTMEIFDEMRRLEYKIQELLENKIEPDDIIKVLNNI